MNIKSYFLTPKVKFFHTVEKSNSVMPRLRNLKIDKDDVKFDNRFLRIFTLLKEIHQLKNQPTDFSLGYFVELFENEVSERNKSVLIKEIKNIGFEKLRGTFEKINMECECYLCETENLFGILKRHQFNKKVPQSDSEKLKQIIQFMHITLIHLNILHNDKNKTLPEKLVAIKNEAFKTIEPFVKKVDDLFINML